MRFIKFVKMYEQTVRGDDFYVKRVYILYSLNAISFLVHIIRFSTDRPRGVSTLGASLARAEEPTAVNFHAGSRETDHSVRSLTRRRTRRRGRT